MYANRTLLRPIIHWKRICFEIIKRLVLCMILTFAISFLGTRFSINFSSKENIVIFLSGLLLCVMINLRKILIQLVYIYQRYAPDRVRLACRFIPSCSEYMILSINKYGAIRGTIKGIKRIIRCRTPNGGIDFP